MDEKGKKLDVRKIDGDMVTGALISDRIVFASKNFEAINTSINFSFSEDGKFKILITDLASGKWQVLKDNKIVIPEATVQEEDGLMYFEGTKGIYTLVKM